MQTKNTGTPQPDDGYFSSGSYPTLSRRQSLDPKSDEQVATGQPQGEAPSANPRAKVQSKAQKVESLDQLPFSESVRILSEAMKAQVRNRQAQALPLANVDDGATLHPKASESLNHLLDTLSSALENAGLEKGSQAALQRILGDIRNSTQYGPKGTSGANSPSPGQGGVIKGSNPGLLNLSA